MIVSFVIYIIADINKVMKNIYTSWNEKQFYQYINEFKVPIDKMYKEFSSGTKMKVKLICAICHNSKLLILDEATNGLDPIIRYDILNLFTKFVANKKNSILISTHITTDLEHIADEIIFINEGKIILDKDMNYLQEHYGLVKCSKEDFKKINQDDYFKNLKYKDECWVLIENKKLFANNYPKLNINIPSIEELMLLFIKGE